ncbi:MAG TPA: oligosaccharide flippase family protein, partial [Tepidisphaeraceae bacterium]
MWRTVKQKILANNALVKRYGLLVTTDLCGKALGLVVAKIAVQRFGADGFGIIGVTLTWVSYALLVGNFGLDSYAVKTAAKRQESIGTLGGTLITMELLFGVAIYAILILVALCVPSLRPHLALISIFGLSLITVALTLNWVPLALERSNITGYVGLAVQATNLLLLVLLLQRSNHLWTFAAAKVSAEVMGAAVLLIWTIQVVGPIKRPLPVAQWWGILRHSAPIGGAMIFRTVSLTCDLALLGIFTAESWRHLRWPAHVDLAQIGQYNGAIKVFGLYLTLGSLYFMVLFPRLAKISNQGMVPLKKAADESLAVVTLGAVGG